MNFPKSEYMKLITRIHVEKRFNPEEQDLCNNDTSDKYYSGVIDKFNQNNKHTWNWPAALFPSQWLIYRGMFIYAFVYIMLIRIPTTIGLLFMLTSLQESGYKNIVFAIFILWLLVDPIAFLTFGKFGNRLYFHFLEKKINRGWNLIPRKNTHGWLVFSLFYFEWLLLFMLPYYLYKKITFNRDLKKAKFLNALNASV